MPRKVVVQAPPPSSDRICCFCGLADDNELEYGKFHEYNGIITHYYCLLLSSNMQQKGRDDEGILGFLPDDINKELKRGKRLACCYCKKTGATLGCCNTKCKKMFHFPCGLKSGSLHQFFGEFRSYCKNHRPKQKIDDRVSEEVKKRDDMICYICYDDVNPRDMYGTLWAPCCKKNAWFHRVCVQQLAMSAGYFFKCPLCNNKAEFQKAMLDHGIFIPSQDASWELVPNAFEELLYRHNRCDADDCLCPKGREHTSNNAKWELTLCRTCGSQGIHMACGQLKWVKPVWECSECISILNKTVTSDSESSSVVQENRQRRRLRGANFTIDEDTSDSEISVGNETMEASTSESSSLKIREHDTEKIHEEPVALRITRRSVIPIPISPVNTKIHTSKAVRTGEDLPPEPKRPRFAEYISQRNHRESIDSDDDIIVISGPSRSESSASNGQESPVQKHSTNNSWSTDKNLQIEDPGFKEEPEEPKTSKIPSTILYETIDKPQPTVTSQVSTEDRTKVVEIDLSDSECTIAETPPTNSIVNEIPDAATVANPPELKIMITNVTSLAPEAFENVQEQKIETKNNLTNVPSRTTIFNESNGGLTPQTPIVLDDEPLPVASTNRVAENNNLHFSSNEIHDQMKLIRFDPPVDASGNPTNAVFYGITIPGTNQTVPLIITMAENANSNPTSAIDSDVNKPAVISSGSNLWKGNHQNRSEINSMIRNVDIPIAPKSNAASLSPSVPLRAIVNETFPMSRTSRKSNDNSNKTVPIIPKNPPAVSQTPMNVPNGSFIRMPASSISPRTPVVKSKAPTSTGHDLSKTLMKPVVNAQLNNSLSNGLDVTTISKMFNLLPPEQLSASQTNSPGPNGVISSTTSRNGRSVLKSNTTTTANVNGNLPNVNTTWLNCQGSVVKTNPDTTNTGVARTNLSPSTQLQIQKSVENKQQIVEQPQFFQLIRTDQNNASSDDCDGDAGSGPAVQPASVNNPANTKPSHTGQATTSPCQRVGTLEASKRGTHERTSDAEWDADTNDAAERSASSDRRDAPNRTGLICRSISLRNLKFSISGSNIVKMTLYDTYTVNIKVDSLNPCKNSKYSSSRRTTKCSLDREAKARHIERCDSNDVSNSLDSLPSSDTDAGLNQSECTLGDNVSTPESMNQKYDLPSIDVESRGHDELKENLDPIPPSVNSAHNATNAVDRKSKLRVRSDVNHSMRSLTEKEGQQMVCEKNETPKKVASQESQSVENHSKVLYNGWKDTACHEEWSTQNVWHDRSDTLVNNLTPRSSVNDSSTEDLDHIQAFKRKRISASVNHLVNDAESSKRKWSSSEDVSRSKKFHVNSTIESDTQNTSGELVNCKVSIDLARIRAVLAMKLNFSNNIVDSKFERRTVPKRTDINNMFDSISIAVLSKSRSFDNLTCDPDEDSIAELRKSRSFEDLSSLSSHSSMDNIVENRMRGCKRKRRSFEEHDCVR